MGSIKISNEPWRNVQLGPVGSTDRYNLIDIEFVVLRTPSRKYPNVSYTDRVQCGNPNQKGTTPQKALSIFKCLANRAVYNLNKATSKHRLKGQNAVKGKKIKFNLLSIKFMTDVQNFNSSNARASLERLDRKLKASSRRYGRKVIHVIINNYSTGIAGIAFVNQKLLQRSTTLIQSSYLTRPTFTHEIGHIMGLNHSRDFTRRIVVNNYYACGKRVSYRTYPIRYNSKGISNNFMSYGTSLNFQSFETAEHGKAFSHIINCWLNSQGTLRKGGAVPWLTSVN